MSCGAPLGMLAGSGPLPVVAARLVARAGRPVYAVQLAETGQNQLRAHCAATFNAGIGQVGRILDFWQNHGVREVLYIGKVDKALHFENLDFDEIALSMLARLQNRRDGSLFAVIADEMEARGFVVVPQTAVLAPLLAGTGHLGGPTPTSAMEQDVRVGLAVADVVSAYDVGQTVAVKQGAVIAIEAFEHTDATLRRAGQLAGQGWTAVKVARPKQDPRFDVPTVGVKTLAAMRAAGGKCLAVEAGRVFVVDGPRVMNYARKYGITVLGVSRLV